MQAKHPCSCVYLELRILKIRSKVGCMMYSVQVKTTCALLRMGTDIDFNRKKSDFGCNTVCEIFI